MTLEKVRERDIDLLILEEFYCSPEFRKWFLNKIKLKESNFKSGKHSVVHPIFGESDLEIDVGNWKLLIENKIDAALQKEQDERYKKRGDEYVQNKECENYKTILISPKKYLKRAAKFDKTITYEELMRFLNSNSKRGKYKAQIIKQGIEQAKRGYVLIPDNTVTAFWKNYYQTVQSFAPELNMKDPSKKPAGSDFVYFNPGFPRNIKLVHKLAHGKVDLQYKDIDFNTTPPGTLKSKAGKSRVIRFNVPKINTSESFIEQEEQVRQGIEAAKVLLEWYKTVQ